MENKTKVQCVKIGLRYNKTEWLFTVNRHRHITLTQGQQLFYYGRGYLQSTVNSQKTLNWLFTVNCQ